MVSLEARRREPAGLLDGTEEPSSPRHPNLAKYFHEEIGALHARLGNEKTQALATYRLCTLVSRIDLMPNGAKLVIVLRGDLAATLTFAYGKKKREFLNEWAVLENLMAEQVRLKASNANSPMAGLCRYHR
ncbi:hypothetical protein [Agrobacterium rubi]|uniref:Uncharacterized protein n=1 Tax=Agrobacterium rubi TaxID=28099 RepID=A0AAE7UQM6_9HYPH|nr:hypothetical protein [Agrobacterium rubi]NTE84978.1 hypothetical protein [Agrobacterium rubi]NTF00910.1 hypothetical protein [Agrobacterium rubi]NTF35098.1 hypothetical protein [Agrobacterium rubi]OCJ48862.1 hypothetical protein A6U92_12220 [Agrobacterium rubi]QTG00311.1 hypothetical protein G6M88_07830 [Agrobacterium rubi]